MAANPIRISTMSPYLQIFTSRRMATLLLLGISSGLPLALTFGTLQAWMKDSGVDLAAIGAITLVGLPYTLKMFWAPLMDRYTPPFLGRRRGWLLTTQLALVVSIILLGSLDPGHSLGLVAACAVLVAFFSASQDIVVDAYRSDVLAHHELGAGAAVFVLGYRLGMLISGAAALMLADILPWSTVYAIMAACMSIGIAACFLGPEPLATHGIPRSLAEAVVQPFKAFFSHPAALALLLLIICYKLPDAIAGAMTTPFLLDIGFAKTEIGAVNKGLGLIATIVGAIYGGALVARFGLFRCLLAFGLLQAVTNLTYMGVAMTGPNHVGLMLAVGIDNLSGGMGSAAFVAFLMSLTERRYSATQYALLSSLMAITPKLAGVPTGFMAESLGWPAFFAISVVGVLPGLVLLGWLRPRHHFEPRIAHEVV